MVGLSTFHIYCMTNVVRTWKGNIALRKKCPIRSFLVWSEGGKIRTRKNSEYENFLRSVVLWNMQYEVKKLLRKWCIFKEIFRHNLSKKFFKKRVYAFITWRWVFNGNILLEKTLLDVQLKSILTHEIQLFSRILPARKRLLLTGLPKNWLRVFQLISILLFYLKPAVFMMMRQNVINVYI